MTTNKKGYMTKYYRRKRKEQIIKFGGKCSIDSNCSGRLEFAHIKETGLKGMGRGRFKRLYDVIKNPNCYKLLCHLHHMEFDHKTGCSKLT